MTILQEPKLNERDFKQFKSLIYKLAGIALADTKQIMVQGRLAKRLRSLSLDSYSDYWDYLSSEADPEELTRFINVMTTNKTDFFREKHHFDFLRSTILSELKQRAAAGGPKRLRIWCAASSTGEEPYTIAMTVRDFFGADTSWDIRILASDIDTEVLGAAERGVYAPDRVADIPSSLLHTYFERTTRGPEANYRVKSTLRDLITFRQINLQNSEWPINTSFDIIFCRNVMIYFDAPSQTKIVEHFAELLHDDSYLIIGHSESLFGLTDLYKPLGDTVYGRNLSVPAPRGRTSSASNRSAQSDKSVKAKVVPDRNTVSDLNTKADLNRTTKMSGSMNSDGLPKHRIIVGEVHASAQPIWITTLLGSCIATCLYDEDAQVGGMNHFMLPDSDVSPMARASFGVHAMEMLINSIMELGGNRKRLKAKLFGGGRVVQNTSDRWNIGQRNIEFAEKFLNVERIPIVASHTGGDSGRQIQFNPMNAKVFVRLLDSHLAAQVDREQKAKAELLTKKQIEHADVTLF